MFNQFIDESVNLSNIYEQCNEHLREQDKKRDQLLAFFGAVTGLIIANIETLNNLNYVEYIYPCFLIVCIILSEVLINYMRWHSIYNYSAITLQNLMFYKQEHITQEIINKIYYKTSQNKNYNVLQYFYKTETKIFNLYLILSSFNFSIYAYIILMRFFNGVMTTGFLIVSIGIVLCYISLMNYRAYSTLKKIFKPSEVDYSKVPSWTLNLYDNKELLNEEIFHKCNATHEYKSKYYDVCINEKDINLINKNHGVVVLPLTADNKVLLINIFRKNISKVVLEIPRGHKEENETDIEAAKRELKEETNCDSQELIDLGYMYPDSGITNSKIHLFLAKNCNIQNIVLQEKESIYGYELSNINEVKNKIYDGRINDSFTIAAVFRCIKYLKEEQVNLNE